MLLIRPGTLAEVQRLVRVDGEKLRFCLAGFLDQFYTDRDRTQKELCRKSARTSPSCRPNSPARFTRIYAPRRSLPQVP
jgi:hypothetical protein